MNKHTYILGGIFLVLILLAILVLQKPGEQSSGNIGNPVFKIDSSAVDKIELTCPAASLTLERRGTEWYITRPISYPASEENIAQLISQTKAMVSRGIITSKPEKHAAFSVGSNGAHVKLFSNGKEQAAFIVGKMGATYMETYIRPTASNDVLLVNGIFSFTFSKPVNDWRSKTICKTRPETINQIAYQYSDTAFVLSLNHNDWFIGNTKAQKSVVDGLVEQLSNVRCSDFIDTALTPAPKITGTVSYVGIQLQFAFDKKSGKYFVQTSASRQLFVMEAWQAAQLLKRKKELLDTVGK